MLIDVIGKYRQWWGVLQFVIVSHMLEGMGPFQNIIANSII